MNWLNDFKDGKKVRISRKQYLQARAYLKQAGLGVVVMATTKDYVEIQKATKPQA